MKLHIPIWILLTSLVVPGSIGHGQEFSVFAGAMETADLGSSSYSWQIEYRHDFLRYASWSVSWINEGHVYGHHRDGLTAQAWGNLPIHDEKIALSLGFGAYRYFDTQLADGGDSSNIHGWAPILSVAATYYASPHWFVRLLANRIMPSENIDVKTVEIGVGYRFGKPRAYPSPIAASASNGNRTTDNEFTVFVGKTVVNTRLSRRSLAVSTEYRRGIGEHFEWTLSLMDEGDPAVVQRYGIATQLWLAGAYLDDRLALSFGFGGYLYVDDRQTAASGHESQYQLAALISPSISYRLSKHWLARLTWNRVSSDYNRDSDVFLFGIGYRWGL